MNQGKSGVSNGFQLFSYAPLINTRFDMAPHQQMSTRLCKTPRIKDFIMRHIILYIYMCVCVFVCIYGRARRCAFTQRCLIIRLLFHH